MNMMKKIFLVFIMLFGSVFAQLPETSKLHVRDVDGYFTAYKIYSIHYLDYLHQNWKAYTHVMDSFGGCYDGGKVVVPDFDLAMMAFIPKNDDGVTVTYQGTPHDYDNVSVTTIPQFTGKCMLAHTSQNSVTTGGQGGVGMGMAGVTKKAIKLLGYDAKTMYGRFKLFVPSNWTSVDQWADSNQSVINFTKKGDANSVPWALRISTVPTNTSYYRIQMYRYMAQGEILTGTYLPIQLPKGTVQDIQFKVQFSSSETAKDGDMKVWVGSNQVEASPTFSIVNSSQIIMQNCGFESGVLSPWTLNANGMYGKSGIDQTWAPTYDGRWAMALKPDWGTHARTGLYTKLNALQPNTQYTISWYSRLYTSYSAGPLPKLEVTNGLAGTVLQSITLPNSDAAYTRHSLTFTTNSSNYNSIYVNIYEEDGGTANQGPWYLFDAFQVDQGASALPYTPPSGFSDMPADYINDNVTIGKGWTNFKSGDLYYKDIVYDNKFIPNDYATKSIGIFRFGPCTFDEAENITYGVGVPSFGLVDSCNKYGVVPVLTVGAWPVAVKTAPDGTALTTTATPWNYMVKDSTSSWTDEEGVSHNTGLRGKWTYNCVKFAERNGYRGFAFDLEGFGLDTVGCSPYEFSILYPKMLQYFRKYLKDHGHENWYMSQAIPLWGPNYHEPYQKDAQGNVIIGTDGKPLPAVGNPVLQWYDMLAIEKQVDAMHLMSYEHSGGWDDRVRYNSAIYADPVPLRAKRNLLSWEQLDSIVIARGMNKNKILWGLPWYAQLFHHVDHLYQSFLVDSTRKLGDVIPAGTRIYDGTTTSAPRTNTTISNNQTVAIGYNDLMTQVWGKPGWTYHWDDRQKNPYLTYNVPGSEFNISGMDAPLKADKFVCVYDDCQSVEEKIKWLNGKGYGGLLVWEMTQDFMPSNQTRANGDTIYTPVLTNCMQNSLIYDGSIIDNPPPPPPFQKKSNGFRGIFPKMPKRLSINTLPPYPFVPVLSSPSNGAVLQDTVVPLSWNSSQNSTSYRLQVSEYSGFYPLKFNQGGITSTQYSMALNSNKTYYWRVQGENAYGNSIFCTPQSFSIQGTNESGGTPPDTTSVIALTSPELVAPPGGGATTLEPLFSWTNPDGSYKYDIQVATDQNFSGNVVDMQNISTNSFNPSVNLLLPASTYYWRVRSRKNTDVSTWTSGSSFHTWNNLPTDAPGSIQLGSITSVANSSNPSNYDVTIPLDIWYISDATKYPVTYKLYTNGVFYQGGTCSATVDGAYHEVLTATNIASGNYIFTVVLYNTKAESQKASASTFLGIGTAPEIAGIKIQGIDDANGNEAGQIVINQDTTFTFALSTPGVASPSYQLLTKDHSFLSAHSISGNTLTLHGTAGGVTGLRIIETSSGKTRNLGLSVRDKTTGKVELFPKYISIGSVSQDDANVIPFWKDIRDGNHPDNKRVDHRYIYLNGSAGDIDDIRKYGRAITFVRNSIRLGITPIFIWYVMNQGIDNAATFHDNMKNATWLNTYFGLLKEVVQTTQKEAGATPIGFVLEPDMIAYMLQQYYSEISTPSNFYVPIESAYTSGALVHGVDPEFPANIIGLTKAINYTIKKYNPSAKCGWEWGLWAAQHNGGKGICHATEPDYPAGMGGGTYAGGRTLIHDDSYYLGTWAKACGQLDYADFISIDKYGLDGGAGSDPNNPYASSWFWNAQIWDNYLYYAKSISEGAGNAKVVLWQLPVGHINSSVAVSPTSYNTGGTFPDLTNGSANYEDSAPTYFFGDTLTISGANRTTYFSTQPVGDESTVSLNGNTLIWKEHVTKAKDSNIICILMGAGVGASTKGTPEPGFVRPSDNYWWITKVQNYYKNPILK